MDQQGQVVRSLEYRDRPAGPQVAEWDGKSQNGTLMPPGLYRYLISATDQEGKPVKVEGRASLTVTGVRMEEGQAKLLVGDLAIDPSIDHRAAITRKRRTVPMGILSSLFTGVSGLNANGNALSVVGNNIANLSTVGFKSSRSVVCRLDQFFAGRGGRSDSDWFGGGAQRRARELQSRVAQYHEQRTGFGHRRQRIFCPPGSQPARRSILERDSFIWMRRTASSTPADSSSRAIRSIPAVSLPPASVESRSLPQRLRRTRPAPSISAPI